jgi:hypothetical protein
MSNKGNILTCTTNMCTKPFDIQTTTIISRVCLQYMINMHSNIQLSSVSSLSSKNCIPSSVVSLPIIYVLLPVYCDLLWQASTSDQHAEVRPISTQRYVRSERRDTSDQHAEIRPISTQRYVLSVGRDTSDQHAEIRPISTQRYVRSVGRDTSDQ